MVGKYAYLRLIVLCIFAASPVAGQKKQVFTGMLEYKISVRDTSMRTLIPDNKMIVYTNDTITRIENFTMQLGKQIAIKHMILGKSYLLIDTEIGNFAIQMDAPDSTSADSTRISDYSFKKKWFRTKVLGKKAKRMEVSHPAFSEPVRFLYFKGYSTGIVDTFEELPGLPVKYSIATPDMVLDYELVKMNEYAPNRDLFGIPSDYERITFNDFMDRMIDNQKNMAP